MRFNLGGERQRYRVAADGSASITFDDKGTGRRCGACQLCCKLLPAPDLRKPAVTRCRHQKAAGKGCGIYADRPESCRVFACGWLADEAASGLSRPDRAHYVIDLAPDYITANGQRIPAVQIWCDPGFPDAHRDPALRAYLSALADRFTLAGLVRYDSRRTLILLPPSLTGWADWVETTGEIGPEHGIEDIYRPSPVTPATRSPQPGASSPDGSSPP